MRILYVIISSLGLISFIVSCFKRFKNDILSDYYYTPIVFCLFSISASIIQNIDSSIISALITFFYFYKYKKLIKEVRK